MKKNAINWKLHERLFPRELDNEAWDAMAEEDFNPDLIHCYGHDMFDAGADAGLAIGLGMAAFASLIELGVKIGRYFKIRKHRKKLEQEYKLKEKEEMEKREKELEAFKQKIEADKKAANQEMEKLLNRHRSWFDACIDE